MLGLPVEISPLSPIPKRRLSLGVVTWGGVNRGGGDHMVDSSQMEPPPPIVSPMFGACGGMDAMVEAASFVRTVSITGCDSGLGVEIVAETEPPEGWEDEDVTQTQREVWLDDEDEETGGRGGIGGDSNTEVDQTQRTGNDNNDDDGSDRDNSEVGSS